MRRLTAALGVAACLTAASAAAETAAEAMTAFGLIGTWSPDCAGPIRVVYAVHPGRAPTSAAMVNGTEQGVNDIQEAVRVAPNRIRWSGTYRKYLPLDVPKAEWMPEPGETWETVLEIVDGKIRSLESRQKDGQKVLVRDGFYYLADDPAQRGRIIWRKTDNPTPFFGRCPPGSP